MTHEYTIAVGGRIGRQDLDRKGAAVTAIAWAADRVLAVGTDDAVRSISRGDSTFLDLRGCVVTAIPTDPHLAEAIVREGSSHEHDIEPRLIRAGLLEPSSLLEPGSLADLAFWDLDPPGHVEDAGKRLGLIATVRHGEFTEGDEHYGPFSSAPPVP